MHLSTEMEAARRRIEFWVHVMKLGEADYIVKGAREAMKVGSRVKGIKDPMKCLKMSGWRLLDRDTLNGLAVKAVKHI